MGEFEKDIRDMFADYELQIDSEEIWPGIEKRLERSRRKKRFLWWWFTPLLLVLPLGYFYATQMGENENNSTAQVSSEKRFEINDKNIGALTQKSENEDYKIKSESKLNNSQSLKNKKSDSKIFAKTKSKSENAGSGSFTGNTTKEIEKSTLVFSDNNATKESTTIHTGDQPKMVVFDKTELLTSLIRPFNYLRKIIPQIKNSPATFEKKAKSTHWDNALDFAMGFAFANKYLNAKEESFNQYKAKRENTESHLEAISASIKHQVKHKSGLFLNAGLNYCQIDEKFSDIDSIDILKSGDGIISILTNNDGSTIENRGKKEVIEHRTWDKEIYNYYFFIDIPVNIGYAGKFKKVNYEISSGISYNLSFLKKGQIIGLYNYPVNIDKESGIFRTHSGFSLNSGIKVLIPYKNHLFFIEPNLKYNLQSLTAGDYPLSQKYLTYGIEIGGRIKL